MNKDLSTKAMGHLPKHSPTPWEIGIAIVNHIYDKNNNNLICIVNKQGFQRQEIEDNARLIVKAVNEYDQNQGALKSYAEQSAKDGIIIKEANETILKLTQCHDELVEALQFIVDHNYRNDNTEYDEVAIPVIALKIIEKALAKAGEL